MSIYENEKIKINTYIDYLQNGELLVGHNILLTGATGGIGECIAQMCMEQGANVVLVGRNQNKLNVITNESKGKAASIALDLEDISKYDSIIRRAHDFFGNIDCLVNCAGISLHEGDFMNVTEQGWEQQMTINLKSPFFLTQSWLKYYREIKIKRGRIVMVASDTSGMGSTIPYGLSKSALASFTIGLAKKLIAEGIRVNAIAPGTTLTEMTKDLTNGEVVRETTLGKRCLFPEEIAQVCVFLLSNLSSCLSGNIIGCSEANICFDNIYREIETNP